MRLFVFLLLVSLAFGLQVLEATYKIHTVQIDNKNKFNAAIFSITFDQDIIFVESEVENPNYFDQSNITVHDFPYQLRFPPLARIPPLNFSVSLYGLFGVKCESEFLYSFPWFKSDADGVSPFSYMLIFPGSNKEVLLNLFSQLGYLDGYASGIDNRRLHAFVILSYIENGVSYLFGEGKFRQVEKDLEAGKCVIHFPGRSDMYGIYWIQGKNDPEPHLGYEEDVIKKDTNEVPCTYVQSLGKSTSIYQSISDMGSAPKWDILRDLQFKNALLRASDSIQSCQSLVKGYMNYETAVVSYPSTTDCLRDTSDPEYAFDPCCNTTLQFLYCCSPTPKDITVPVVKSVNTNVVKCKNNVESMGLLQDFVINTNNAEHPIDGCLAVSSRTASDDLVVQYSGYIETCLNNIYGNDWIDLSNFPTCTTDDDCETYCNYGFCFIDFMNPDKAMLNCHMRLIDPFVIRLLKAEWQLPLSLSDTEFRQEYFTRMRTMNCIGLSSSYYTWLFDSRNDIYWTTANRERCTSEYYCNYDHLLNETYCETDGDSCNYLYANGFSYSLTYHNTCYLEILEENQCKRVGGNWDANMYPYECTLNVTKNECMPPQICGPRETDDFVEKQCNKRFCYDLTIVQSKCTSASQKWNSDVVSGSGFCELLVSTPIQCSIRRGKWWDGRVWINAKYDTKEECDLGACVTGNNLFLTNKCEEKAACSTTCNVCTSIYRDNICYGSNVTEAQCVADDGLYDSTADVCFYFITYSECINSRNNWLACQDLNQDQCISCAANEKDCPLLYDRLNCDFAFNSECNSQKICTESSGYCNDGFFNFRDKACALATFPDANCYGSCLHDLIAYPNGEWGCSAKETYTLLGCIDPDVKNRAECDAKTGYRWKETFTNQKDCLTDMACHLPSGVVNLQSPVECYKCGGEIKPVFEWEKGEWKTSHKLPLKFEAKNFTEANKWGLTFDFQLISDTVNRLAANTFSRSLQTESMCLYNPLLEVISHIACDCAQDPNAPPTCYSAGTRVISVGVHRFYVGIPDSIKAGSVTIDVMANSIPLTVNYVDVDVDIASATQFRKKETLSVNALSASLASNPYSIVTNSHGIVVGQIVGDGVIISFLPEQKKRSVADPNFKFQNPLQVCIAARSDISMSNDFPVLDFSITTDYLIWKPMSVNVTESSKGYCFSTTQQGIYFPIRRMGGNWDSITTSKLISNKAVLAFIYIFGIISILLSFISVYQVFMDAYTLRRISLGIVLFSFMFLFNMVRGLYFLILPSKLLEDNQPAEYFLAESPQFFFFTVYSCIIFVWAELSRIVVRHKNFLHHFKWPFILTNAGLYVLFIVVVSVFQSISPNRQTVLKRVYVIILASCCFIAVVSFNFFGKKLISTQLSVSSIKSSDPQSTTLRKMIITMVVSSLTLIAQIVFLFVTTYNSVSPQIALVAYILTEIIPSATLIYTLKPLSRKLRKPSTTKLKSSKISSTTNSNSSQSQSSQTI